MRSVYAVVFNTGVVKFGRSRNLLRRVQEHVTVGRHHGAEAIYVLASMVPDEVRAESDLLAAASRRLERAAAESFRVHGLADAADCFNECWMQIAVFRINRLPLTLTLDEMTYAASLPRHIPDPVASAKKSPIDKAKDKVLSHLSRVDDSAGIEELKGICGSLRVKDVEGALMELIADGDVEVFYAKSPAGREIRYHGARRYRLAGGK